MLTLDVPVTDDLSAYEFEMACEVSGCLNPAVVMCKGCNDPDHQAICAIHLKITEDRFQRRVQESFIERKPAYCLGCNYPWLEFEGHYNLLHIRSTEQ